MSLRNCTIARVPSCGLACNGTISNAHQSPWNANRMIPRNPGIGIVAFSLVPLPGFLLFLDNVALRIALQLRFTDDE